LKRPCSGTTEFVAWPILKKSFKARGIASEPLLAHSFERVMPGRDYVSSIRDFGGSVGV
jgi:UDP-N-acetyl-D-mannosaminuronate dehydrogenase